MGLRLVHPDDLTEAQKIQVSEGIIATNATVPHLSKVEGTRMSFVSDSENRIIGSLVEMPVEDGVIEIGTRFWVFTPRIALLLNDWVDSLLRSYNAVIARVYPSNWRVKKLLVRGGFRLFRIEDGLEHFIVTPAAFMGRRRSE